MDDGWPVAQAAELSRRRGRPRTGGLSATASSVRPVCGSGHLVHATNRAVHRRTSYAGSSACAACTGSARYNSPTRPAYRHRPCTKPEVPDRRNRVLRERGHLVHRPRHHHPPSLVRQRLGLTAKSEDPPDPRRRPASNSSTPTEQARRDVPPPGSTTTTRRLLGKSDPLDARRIAEAALPLGETSCDVRATATGNVLHCVSWWRPGTR